MHFTVSVSIYTLIAILVTVVAFGWASWASANEPGGGFFPNPSGLFYFGGALVVSLLIWLSRACVALSLGV
jgi:hypothetical protein